MYFTNFSVTQDGRTIGSFTCKECAVSAAKSRAADTGKPVSVMAHIASGGTKEAIFNPDGTNEKIWNIDKGRPLVPAFGQVYLNRGGGEYRCIDRMPVTGATYYNASGGSSDTMALFQNIRSGWTFFAKGIIQYIDGTIEWDHSSDGRFKEATKFDFVDEQPVTAAKEYGKSALLVHMDYGEGEHGYILYGIPSEKLDEAGTAIDTAWAAYDGGDRQGQVEEAFEDAFRKVGIPFTCEDYDVRRIAAERSMGMRIVTQDDIRYTEQTEALDEIAAKLGVVACRPDRHGSNGDKNTVMFYTPEDEEHNRMVDLQPVHYSRSEVAALGKDGGPGIPDKYIYRDSVWTFENSDVNGLLDMDFANRGKVDLRSPGWKERLEGHIGLALLRKRQRQYVLLSGGWSELRESDEALNDFNRSIITHMKMAYGRLYLGSVNYYDGQRERISSGEESVYEEYAGQKIYNFHCAFAVPERDEALEEMIRAWNRGTGPRHAELAEQITKRVDELGGEHFVWY